MEVIIFSDVERRGVLEAIDDVCYCASTNRTYFCIQITYAYSISTQNLLNDSRKDLLECRGLCLDIVIIVLGRPSAKCIG